MITGTLRPKTKDERDRIQLENDANFTAKDEACLLKDGKVDIDKVIDIIKIYYKDVQYFEQDSDGKNLRRTSFVYRNGVIRAGTAIEEDKKVGQMLRSTILCSKDFNLIPQKTPSDTEELRYEVLRFCDEAEWCPTFDKKNMMWVVVKNGKRHQLLIKGGDNLLIKVQQLPSNFD